MVFDTAGNMYVANATAKTVSKVTPTGAVSTFASGFGFPDGLAIDAANNVYVSDGTNNAVYKVTPGGVVSTFASGLNGQPNGLAFDPAGNLYVSGATDGSVNKIDPAGVVTPFASGLSHPLRPQFGPDGNLYVPNYGTNSVVRIDPTGKVSTFASGLNGPDGVAFDQLGNLFVSEYGQNGNGSTVSKVTADGVVSHVAGGLPGPGGLGFGPDGSLYVADYGPNGTGTTVVKLAPPPVVQPVVTTGLTAPDGIAFDKAGNLYVANLSGGTVTKVTPAGVESTFASGLNGPNGLTFDSAGNLYVTNYGSPGVGTTITKITPAGVASTFASGLNQPHSLEFGPDGNLYVSNYGTNSILKVTPAGAVSPFVSGITQPVGIAFDAAGNLFVATRNGKSVQKVTPAGVVTTFAANLGVTPYGLTFDKAGNLDVADIGGNTVLQITPAGAVSTLATGQAGANALAYGPNGNLYVSDRSSNTIAQILPAGSVAVPFTTAGTGTSGTDFTVGTPSPLVFAPGQTTASITGTLPAQTGANNTTAVFTLGTPSGFVAGGTPTVNTLTIAQPPTLATVGPAAIPAGNPDTTINLTGTAFTPGAVVTVNGMPVATTYVDPTHLTAVVPAADFNTPGTLTVGETDAGGTTGTKPVTVTQLTITSATPPNPTTTQPYSFPVTTAGGAAPVAYTVTAGSLPAGLSLDPQSGIIGGTPTATGTFGFTVTATDGNGRTAAQPDSLIVSDPLAVTTKTIAAPSKGVAYTQPIAITGGRGPDGFAVTAGSLPAGLMLDPASGVISGTPTANGPYSFAVTATDADGRTATSPTFSGTVTDPLAVTTTAIPPASKGVPYTAPIATTGGQGPDTFAVTAGSLPAGLMLDPASGVISGTPAANGPYSFAVTATDAAGRTATSPTFSGTVTDPLAVTTTAIPPASKGVPYTAPIATTGGQGPDTFAVTAGSLPAGLMLDPSSGVVSGTPTADGPFSFAVTATDAAGRTATSPTFSGTVTDPLAVVPVTLAPTTKGTPFAQTEAATGGQGPDTFAVSAGTLPAGLTLNPTSGVISGSPTTDGPVSFAVTATDAAGRTAVEPYTGLVVDPLAISTPTLAAPTRGLPYRQPVAATGGRGADTFAVTAGSLPAGLALDPKTGVISGTPTTDGPFHVTVQATDADGRVATMPYTGQVSDPLAVGPAALAPTTNGTPFTQTEVPTGGRGPDTFAVTAGALPAGLALDPKTGVISGTPTTDGPVSFSVTATDADGRTATAAYAGTVVDPLAITTTALPVPVTGAAYSQPVAVTGGRGADTFAVTAGAMPAGLALDPATGVISGTPAAAGPYGFTVTGTDADGRTSSQAYAGTVVDPITFGTGGGAATGPAGAGTLADGTTGTGYAQSAAATGGAAPLSYAVSAGALPPGVTLDPQSGALAGVPTAPGTYTFTVTATDANGMAGSKSYTVVVADPLAVGGAGASPGADTGTLPGGFAGATYANLVPTTGGTRPTTFAVTAGALPPGLTLTSDGTAAGVPTAPGTYTFTVTATDADGRTASRAETVTIQAGSDLSQFYGVAAGLGGASRVRVYDRTTGAGMADFYAFEPSFKGGANVVVGDVNGDGVPDIVVAAGAGGGARVEVIDGTKMNAVLPDGEIDPSAVLANFFAFDSNLRGGASVALARLDNGKGLDIVVGAGLDGGPRVRTFAFTPGVAGGVTQLPGAIGSFYAFDPSQRFGVNVAAGNLDGTGVDSVIVGEGLGAAPMVAVFRADGSERERFTADNLAPAGGASVAAGYLDGTPEAQLVVGTGPGAAPNVDVYTGTSTTPERIVRAFEPGFTGGVSVNSGPAGQQSDIFLGAGPGGGPRVRVLTPDGVQELFNFFSYEPTFLGGVNVG